MAYAQLERRGALVRDRVGRRVRVRARVRVSRVRGVRGVRGVVGLVGL